MKKVLLASSALAVVGIWGLPASAADVTSGLELKVSGFVAFQATLLATDSDHSTIDRDYDFQSGARLIFDIKNTTDSGLTYGGRIRFNAVNRKDNVQVDRTYVYVQGSFGTITLGNGTQSAADFGYIYAHDEQAGEHGSGYYGDLLDGSYFLGGGKLFSIDPTYQSGISNEDTRIKYTSPDIGGFSFGADFTPTVGGADYAGNGGRSDLYNNDTLLYENVISGGVNYQQDFGDVGVRVGGSITYGNGVRSTDNPDGRDARIYTFGGQVSSGGIYASVNWVRNESVAAYDKPISTVIGDISYDVGPFLASVSYAYTWTDGRNNGVNSSYTSGEDLKDNHLAGVNLTYTLAPGLNAYGEVIYEKQNYRVGRDFETATIGTGLSIAF